MKKVLPRDTEVSEYFYYKDRIFEKMSIPDGRVLIQIVHTWGDGELMNFGFQYKDGISRKGINPLCIVGIYYDGYDDVKNLKYDQEIEDFLQMYTNKLECGVRK